MDKSWARVARWVAASACTVGAVAGVSAQSTPNRGQLLYETHCIACHTTQMHWRESRRATDWSSLVAQVRRWQGETQLKWTEGDIDAVARHLNDTIYRFKPPATVASLAVIN